MRPRDGAASLLKSRKASSVSSAIDVRGDLRVYLCSMFRLVVAGCVDSYRSFWWGRKAVTNDVARYAVRLALTQAFISYFQVAACEATEER